MYYMFSSSRANMSQKELASFISTGLNGVGASKRLGILYYF